MHRLWPELKRCTDSGQKRNECTQSTFLDTSDVLVRFGQFRYCAKKTCSLAFNAPIQAGTETMHRFVPETKRTHPNHFLGPNSDVLVRFGQFRYCAKNHAL